jgi:hypothetical protein
MGKINITLEGQSPYDPLLAKAPTAKPMSGYVEMTLPILVGGETPDTVAILVHLAPTDALALANQIKAVVGTAERWGR